jgi:hypothetical protein
MDSGPLARAFTLHALSGMAERKVKKPKARALGTGFGRFGRFISVA